jgi:hypothetical protein
MPLVKFLFGPLAARFEDPEMPGSWGAREDEYGGVARCGGAHAEG